MGMSNDILLSRFYFGLRQWLGLLRRCLAGTRFRLLRLENDREMRIILASSSDNRANPINDLDGDADKRKSLGHVDASIGSEVSRTRACGGTTVSFAGGHGGRFRPSR